MKEKLWKALDVLFESLFYLVLTYTLHSMYTSFKYEWYAIPFMAANIYATCKYYGRIVKITGYDFTPIYTLAENQCDGFRRVVRIDNAMSAYELNFVDKITESCYENMDFAMKRILERVNSGKTDDSKK